MKDEKELILVVEDSDYLNNYITSALRNSGYEVVQAKNADQAYKSLASDFFSLVLLDINLGDGDSGMDILHVIRQQNQILPVMIVSSISDDKTKIDGFREGCDDYITKPFYIAELMLRIKRMIDRFSMMNVKKDTVSKIFKVGRFEVDFDNQLVKKDGKVLQMRNKQFKLMVYFIQHPNSILSLNQIYEGVWFESSPDEKTLQSNMYVNIRSLRMLIEDDKNNPQHILSVSKLGYIFVP